MRHDAKIVVASCAGACYGVQRACDLTWDAVGRGESVATLGPLIHNPTVVEALAQAGVRVVGSPDEIEGGTVVIRSHGVAPEIRQKVKGLASKLVDATCPFVAKAQRQGEKLAALYGTVIVIGEAGHPEVEGLCAFVARAGGRSVVVSGPSDLPPVLSGPVGVLVQTTQRVRVVDEVLDALRQREVPFDVSDTICHATTQRQDAAARLASISDAMVVIGGRNSSNTTRLAEICLALCPKTHHVESADELKRDWFASCRTVGITAGASTPESQVLDVVEHLENWRKDGE